MANSYTNVSNNKTKMAVKTIYLAGVPASGKSTLFKMIRSQLFDEAKEFKDGKCRGIENGAYEMLGVFDGSTFEGTEKLSMTVIGDAIEHIKKLSRDNDRHVVFVEGDRLFNYRFLRETRAVLFLIDASEKELYARHIERGDTQTHTFLRSRRSKVENFIAKYNAQRIWNNNPQDQKRIFDYIIKIAKEYVDERK